jgi:hypothetical protein
MNKISPNSPHRFSCEFCNIKTNNKKDYTKHCLTAKHLNRTSEEPKNPISPLTCKRCKKTYKARNSLWYHEQKCKQNEPQPTIEKSDDENKSLANIVIELIKSNVDLQKQIMEVCKNSQINNSTINSHNKTFNLQFFLNEQCKDAMNLADFVNSMTLEFSDLEEVGTLGYVEGISNIIIRKLNAMDIYKRPIHCSDGKREIMFVKQDDVWEKENNTNDKLRKAIKQVTYKNSSLLVPWSEKYPNCMNNQHSLNDVYVRMMGQAMGGREAFVDSENKIMKKIAKAVLIEKM